MASNQIITLCLGRSRDGKKKRELAHQRNARKQSDMNKSKKKDDRLSAAARKQRDAEIMKQKQKKANEKLESKAK